MDKLYWIFEYGRVLTAYFFILYLWPSVVFKKHLKKKKSRTYKFVFCSVVQLIIINTVVLGLGLIGLLKPFIINILFYGSFLFFLFKDVKIERKTLLKGKYFVSGTYGLKSLFSDIFGFIKRKAGQAKDSFLKFMEGHWGEYGLLFLLVAFGVVYFSVNSFEQNSYGFGDLYTHHSWTYNLVNGQIFSSGIYPEAMHCLIAMENFSFGISIYNALLFTGPVFSSVILVSIYIMFRELFKWKWTPMLVLALILFVDVKCLLAASSFARWQWTMPQEYGFPAMFFCLTYLIRFFKNGKKYKRTKVPMFLKDDDLLLFTFSVAATIAAHFYATIMAVMLCIGGACVLIGRFFSKKFPGFLIACFAGLFIAIVPMLGALAEGYHFQGSVRWAMSLILTKEQFEALYGDTDAVDRREEELEKEREEEERKEREKEKASNENADLSYYDRGKNNNAVGKVGTLFLADRVNDVVKDLASMDAVSEKPAEPSPFRKTMTRLYNGSYAAMYGEKRAAVFVGMSILALIIWAVIRIFVFIRRRQIVNYPLYGHMFDGYIVIVIGSILFTITYALRYMGLPELLEQYRVCSVAQIMCLALLLVPVDVIGVFVFENLNRNKGKTGMIIAYIMVILIYAGAKLTGNFHGYLMIELTRYNSSVLVTNAINRTMGYGANNFTIVSTTDELYPVLGYGFHEELISFINNSEIVTYTIPTEYIFIYIEKNVLSRAQYHLASGPKWLAEDKYAPFYEAVASTSVQPDIVRETISEEYANLFFGRFPETAMVYNTLWQRTLLNSKAFVWCQKFNAMYPNELHTFYEDDNLLVYYLRQNPRNLYELATMDTSVMVPPEEYNKPIWPENYKAKMDN